MRGFLVLAAAYGLCWVALLAPGVVVARRLRRPEVPAAVVPDRAWASALASALRGPARPVDAERLPVTHRETGRRRRALPAATREVWALAGGMTMPESCVLAGGLFVDGDLVLESGSAVLGPVVVAGRVALEAGAVLGADLVATRGVRFGEGARVDGSVWSGGAVHVGRGAVAADVGSEEAVVLVPGSAVRSAHAPAVWCAESDEHRPGNPPGRLRAPAWTPDMDDALVSEWPEGRLAEIADRFAERTGLDVRGVHLLARARQLGLHASGLPQRPAVLGGRPAWLLAPEVVRVGADLQVPPGGVVSYALVVEGAMEVFEGAELEAAVRTGRGLLLRSGCVVHAQVVSDGLIVCEEDVTVAGPADSSASILLFAGASVGRPGFGGCHAQGFIGLEPGAVVFGPTVAGVQVRGEPRRSRQPRPAATGDGEPAETAEDGGQDDEGEADWEELPEGSGSPERRSRRRRGVRGLLGRRRGG